jgi:hypothetical protein
MSSAAKGGRVHSGKLRRTHASTSCQRSAQNIHLVQKQCNIALITSLVADCLHGVQSAMLQHKWATIVGNKVRCDAPTPTQNCALPQPIPLPETPNYQNNCSHAFSEEQVRSTHINNAHSSDRDRCLVAYITRCCLIPAARRDCASCSALSTQHARPHAAPMIPVCHISHAICHMSLAMYHMQHVTCNMALGAPVQAHCCAPPPPCAATPALYNAPCCSN